MSELMQDVGESGQSMDMPPHLVAAHRSGVLKNRTDLQHNVTAHLREAGEGLGNISEYSERWRMAGLVVDAYLAATNGTPEA